ncbi:ferredoxin [Nocardiopsis oceani]
MRIGADIGKCQGYGNCVVLDSEHFDLDDEGMVVVLRESVEENETDKATEAVRSCPVNAIWLTSDEA